MSSGKLRTLAFVLTAAGALIAGAGATTTWTSIGFRGDVQGVLDSEFVGTDLTEGIAVLVLSAATLVALLIARRAQDRVRRMAAIAIVVFGIAIVLLPTWVAIRAEDRAIDEAAEVVADTTGMSTEEAANLIRTNPDLAIEVSSGGVFIPIAGGVLVVLGGVLSVLAARGSERTPGPD
jgi:hypothetical protein